MPERDWYKYIKRNRTCGDCQLVSIVNAYHYLTGKTITEKRYMKLAEKCGCTSGACINVEHAMKSLGLEFTYLKEHEVLGYGDKRIKLPMEAFIWHPNYGWHSVLIVDQELKSQTLRITGFDKETNSHGWIFREKFVPYLKGKSKWLDEDNEIYKTESSKYGYRREKYTFRLITLKNP